MKYRQSEYDIETREDMEDYFKREMEENNFLKILI